MKVYEEGDVQIQVFLTSALFGDEWSVTRPGAVLLSAKEPPVPIG
jgi:hypothetical protein